MVRGLDSDGCLSVPGWEHFGMDLVVIMKSSCLYFVNNHGIIHRMTTHIGTSPSITKYSGNNNCPNYLINFTKSLRNRGFSLVESNRYSNYSAFTLQYGGDRYGELYIIYVYVIIAQRNEPHQNEYSVFCNISPNAGKLIDGQPPHSIQMDSDKRDYSKKILKLLNQGKEAIIHSSYYEVNDEGRKPENFDSFYEGHWEYDIDERFYDYFEEISKVELDQY